MRIGVLSERAGVSPRTVRYYEKIGLLGEPARTAGGYRDYTDADVERLSFIRRARQLGLALTDISELLSLRDEGQPPCARVVEMVTHELGEVDRRIRELQSVRNELKNLLDRAAQGSGRPSNGGSVCALIEQPALAMIERKKRAGR